MNKDIIAGRWKQLVGQATARWGRMTDSDWTILRGQVEQFFGNLQERYGLSRDQALAAIDEVSTKAGSIAASVDSDRLADQTMDSDYGSSPRVGMDNLAATPVADPPPTYLERVEVAIGRFGRQVRTTLKRHPGASLMAAVSVALVAARWATPSRRG